MNLVDLAGAEKIEKTGAQGQQLKEGIAINQSLSALAKVSARVCWLDIGGISCQKECGV